MNKPLLLASLLAFALLSAGCDNFNRSTKVVTTTLGKEISDLKTALDQGAIDEEQYQKLLDEIIEQRTNASIQEDDKPVRIIISGDE